MRYLMVIMMVFLGGVGLVAQKVKEEKQQRWCFSTQFGLDTYPEFTTSFYSTESKMLFAELGYRIHRHLDIGVQLGFMGETTSGFQRIENADFRGERLEVSWDNQMRNLFAGLEAKLNYRIGQGDLSFGVTFGMLRHGSLFQARSPRPFRAELRMEPLLYGFHKVQIGYTYWATSKFGLVMGLSIFTHDIGNTSRNVYFNQGGTPFYSVKELEVEGLDVTEDDFLALRYLSDNGTTHYLMLGLTAKIF